MGKIAADANPLAKTITVYLERAVASLTEQKTEIQPELLAHLSPAKKRNGQRPEGSLG